MSKGFNRIFIGLIFLFFDINIMINLLPDFIGYILVLQGCIILSKYEKSFNKTIWPLEILSIGSIIQVLGRWIGIGFGELPIYYKIVDDLINFAFGVIWIYTVYHICKSIYNIAEINRDAILKRNIKSTWKWMLSSFIVGGITVPWGYNFEGMRLYNGIIVLVGIVSLISMILFMILIYRCKKLVVEEEVLL